MMQNLRVSLGVVVLALATLGCGHPRGNSGQGLQYHQKL
jgi:hypothetical protein